MDASTIQVEIQNAVDSIINLLEKIQVELDELNSFTKPNGELDIAVKEGLESSKTFFKMSGCSIKEKDPDITELHTNIGSSTLKDSQCVTTADGTSQDYDDTTQ